MAFSSSIIARSGIAFGTSGARGLVSDFTPDVCAAFALAFAHVMQQEGEITTIALANDNRPSSYQMAQAISAGLAQINITTQFYGVIPTPALAYYAMQHNMPCIMVTGSHIPFDRNGLKFYKAQGEITKADEVAILAANVPLSAITTLPELSVLSDAKDAYIRRNTEIFKQDALAGKRIGIYEHSSAGRDIYNLIFEALGAEVIPLGRSDAFVPIDTEAVAEEDKAKARVWAKQHHLDALFSTDGDGDRPLLSDQHGEWLRGDTLGLLCAKVLGIEALSIPVSCNTAIEISQLFKQVTRTKIGSPFVIAEFGALSDKYQRVAGFEANGGFLLASNLEFNGKTVNALPTRDALLPVITVLTQLTQASVSEQLAALPKRFTESDRIKGFARENSQALLNNIKQSPELWLQKLGLCQQLTGIDNTDGVRMTFNNGDIVHLRPSGNAPELRCYAESDSEQMARNDVTNVRNKISTL